MKIIVPADGSFANNIDHITQLGYIVLLTDGNAKGKKVYLSPFKSQRVVRSVLGGEMYALAAAVDLALVLSRDASAALSREVPVVVLTY